jgi:hypothetical protein
MSLACKNILYTSNRHLTSLHGPVFYTLEKASGIITVYNNLGQIFVIRKPVYQIQYTSKDVLYIHYNGADGLYGFYDPSPQFMTDLIMFYCTDITSAGCKKKKNCLVSYYSGTKRVIDGMNRSISKIMAKRVKSKHLYDDLGLEKYL